LKFGLLVVIMEVAITVSLRAELAHFLVFGCSQCFLPKFARDGTFERTKYLQKADSNSWRKSFYPKCNAYASLAGSVLLSCFQL